MQIEGKMTLMACLGTPVPSLEFKPTFLQFQRLELEFPNTLVMNLARFGNDAHSDMSYFLQYILAITVLL